MAATATGGSADGRVWSIMANNCGIYQIKNIATGDYYIGSSCNIQKRIWTHRWCLSKNTHCNRHLQNSWNKHGEDSFEFNLILLCEPENKLYYEQVLLDGLHPTYNLAINAAAPTQGLPVSEETRRKLGEASRGNKNNLGHKLSEEHKRKLSEAHKGHAVTKETRRKISAANQGRTHSEEACRHMSEAHKGKILSEEQKRRISESQKGKTISEEQKHKISEAKKGKPNGRLGKHLSAETRAKISESQKGELNWNFGGTASEETRTKMSKSAAAAWAKRKAEARLSA